jgi:hypothetical protein
MIYFVVIPLFLLMFVVFQHSVPGMLFSTGITLEMSLIIAVYAGFRMDLVKGGGLALVLGFILDCLTGTISGFYTVIYFALFSLAFLISPRIYAESAGFIVLATFVCGLIEGFLIIAANYFLYRTDVHYDLLCYFFPQLLIVSGVSPLFFKIFDKFGSVYGGYAWPVRRT